jgi:hypothetical protein
MSDPDGGTPAATITSSNPTLVPAENIVQTGNSLAITAAGTQTGSATITILVSDGQGGKTSTSFTFEVANAQPNLAHNAVTGSEGATITLGSAALQVTDADNTAAQLTFTLGTTPLHGTLKKSGVDLAAGSTFTQTDVNTGAITYVHDGGETISDSFSFTVADGDGGTLATSSLNITVTPVNDAPTITANAALAFDGVDDEVVVGNAAAVNITGSLTLESWFKVPVGTNVNSATIAGKWELGVATQDSYTLGWDATGNLTFSLADAQQDIGSLGVASSYVDGKWHHVAGVWDAIGKEMHLYVDGVLVATEAKPDIGALQTTNSDFEIGSFANGTAGQFPGTLDEVRLWSKALTGAEVASGMNGTIANDTVGLAGRWSFDEGTGTSVADATASANAGTIANGAHWSNRWTEGDTSPISVGRFAITDPDSANATRATVTIGSYQSGADVLSYVASDGITGTFNAATGVLTLTGTRAWRNMRRR